MAEQTASQKFIWVCDPGSTHLTLMAGCYDQATEEVSVLGSATVPNSGIKRGTVVDLESLTSAIQDAADEVETQTGLNLTELRVCVSNQTSIFENRTEQILLRSGEVKASDIEKLVYQARLNKSAQNYECIHALFGMFEIDNKKSIANPIGLFGNQLLLNHHRIQLPAAELKSISRSFENAGIKVTQFVSEPLSSAESVLLPEEKEFGAVVINLGATQTHIAVYQKNVPIYCSSIPVASSHITKDIAIGMRTTLTQAEKIKRESVTLINDKAGNYELVDVSSIDGLNNYKVYRSEIVKIVEARVLELFENVHIELKKMRLTSPLSNSLVLTGGGAAMRGIVPFAEKTLGANARLGIPRHIVGTSEMFKSSIHSSCLGLFSPIFQGTQTWIAGNQAMEQREKRFFKYTGSLINKILDNIL